MVVAREHTEQDRDGARQGSESDEGSEEEEIVEEEEGEEGTDDDPDVADDEQDATFVLDPSSSKPSRAPRDITRESRASEERSDVEGSEDEDVTRPERSGAPSPPSSIASHLAEQMAKVDLSAPLPDDDAKAESSADPPPPLPPYSAYTDSLSSHHFLPPSTTQVRIAHHPSTEQESRSRIWPASR